MISKHWLVIYDISESKRLSKVAKICKEYGKRVQKSVFEIDCCETVLEIMRNKIEEVIDFDVDYVVYFDICEKDWQKREKYGPLIFELEEEKSYYIL